MTTVTTVTCYCMDNLELCCIGRRWEWHVAFINLLRSFVGPWEVMLSCDVTVRYNLATTLVMTDNGRCILHHYQKWGIGGHLVKESRSSLVFY